MRAPSVRREGYGYPSGTHPYILAAESQMLQLLFVSLVCSSALLLWCVCAQLEESEHAGEFTVCAQDRRPWSACFSHLVRTGWLLIFPTVFPLQSYEKVILYLGQIYPDGSNVASLTVSPRDMEERLLGIVLHKLAHRICHLDHRKG